MTIVFSSSIRAKKENIEVTMPSFEEVKISGLSRHIAYENHAVVEEPRRYKKKSSEKLNGILYSLKLSNRPVEHY